LIGAITSFTSSASSVSDYSLNWVTTDEATCSIDQGVGSAAPTISGLVSVTPTVTTNYTLSCNDNYGNQSTLSTTAVICAAATLKDATNTCSYSMSSGTLNFLATQNTTTPNYTGAMDATCTASGWNVGATTSCTANGPTYTGSWQAGTCNVCGYSGTVVAPTCSTGNVADCNPAGKPANITCNPPSCCNPNGIINPAATTPPTGPVCNYGLTEEILSGYTCVGKMFSTYSNCVDSIGNVLEQCVNYFDPLNNDPC
jgi:hypothetical protein